jgi:hypothetical protein
MPEDAFRPQRPPLISPGQIDCHVADMTATIAADLTLQSVQTTLAAHNQWLPIDGDPSLPIGQLVEENSTGPLRLGYGAWRDLLLGCQFKTGDGRLITAGGRTMKNVAGYDLVKVMVGQRRILGEILTITVRTYKRWPNALVAEFEPSDQWLGKTITTPLRPRYAILQPDSLTCGWHDDDRALALFSKLAQAHQPQSLVQRSLEEDIEHRAKLWCAPIRNSPESFRTSVPPSRILSFVAQASLKNWSADAAFGIIIGPSANLNVASIRSAAENHGGSTTFFQAGRPPQWEPNEAEQAILAALKNAFAPAG